MLYIYILHIDTIYVLHIFKYMFIYLAAEFQTHKQKSFFPKVGCMTGGGGSYFNSAPPHAPIPLLVNTKSIIEGLDLYFSMQESEGFSFFPFSPPF